MTPTPEDLALDVQRLLETCEWVERNGAQNVPTDPPWRTFAALCRRVIAAEEEASRLTECYRQIGAAMKLAVGMNNSLLKLGQALQAAIETEDK